MSIHLVGGGWDGALAERVYGSFLAEAIERGAVAGRPARIGIVIVSDDDAPARFEQFGEILTGLGECDPIALLAPEDGAIAPESLDDLDALLVGGGLTPAYHAALSGCFPTIRAAVGAGLPYLGFSAGAAIAAGRAVVGGWMINGRAVCGDQTAEELEEVTVVPGIDLVDFAVDVHAAQWGTTTRLIAAVEAGLVTAGVAVDENTALIVNPGGGRVVGTGQIWQVQAGEDGAVVRTAAAG